MADRVKHEKIRIAKDSKDLNKMFVKTKALQGLENHGGCKISEKQKTTSDVKSTKTKKNGLETIYVRSKRIARRLSNGCSLLSLRRKHTTKQQHRQQSVDKHVLQLPKYNPIQTRTKVWKSKIQIFACDYEEEVMRYLLEVEKHHLPTRNYLVSHPSVTQRARAMLIDWMIQVQSYLELSQETLYQSIHMVDRVLKMYNLALDKLQLLAITAFFIVSKLEEKEPIEARDLLGLTLGSYTLQELLALEKEVLKVLDLNLISVDPSTFLEFFAYLTCNYDDKMVMDCANFLMETVLIEVWPIETRPSLFAAAALFGSLQIIHGAMASMVVCTLIPDYFSLEDSEIIATSLRMLEAVANQKHSPFQGAVEKYRSKSRHNELSLLPELQAEAVLVAIDMVRTTLISLKDLNIIVRNPSRQIILEEIVGQDEEDFGNFDYIEETTV